MKEPLLRHKHFRLDQNKLDRLQAALGARSETEALEQAMDLLLAEEEIKQTLVSVKGKGRLDRVFD